VPAGASFEAALVEHVVGHYHAQDERHCVRRAS
jgi:hypothetical protein